MAAYAQFGYNYPTANQLLNGVAAQSSSVAAAAAVAALSSSMTASNIGIANGNAPSPLSGGNDASLSPSGGSSASTTGGNTAADPLSPGAVSQTSNNTNNNNNATNSSSLSILHSSTANAIGLSLSLNADASGVGGGSVPDADMGIGIDAGAAGGVGSAVNDSTTPCCENGRPIMTDPLSGQTVCSCQYDSARLALSSYSRMPGGASAPAGVGVYGTPYPSSEQNPYPSIGVDSSAFYSPLSNPYALKDGNGGSDMSAWTSASLQPTTGYYSYDPIAAYGYGSSYDLAARRKNATRESTATLKAWLSEHKKNPYPTKGEKIMLAIITKMTLTQVSTWFANARRRLKKENKMTWEPKNKTDDDDDAMLSDDEKDKDTDDMGKLNGASGVSDNAGNGGAYGGAAMGSELRKDDPIVKSEILGKEDKTDGCSLDEAKFGEIPTLRSMGSVYNSPYSQHPSYHPYQQQHPSTYYQQQQQQQHFAGMTYGAPSQLNAADDYNASKNLLRAADCGIPLPASKPKIWSLADTVACKTPPPPLPPPIQMTTYQQQQQQQQMAQQQSLLQSRQQYYQQISPHLQQSNQHNSQNNNSSGNLQPAHSHNNSTSNNNLTSLSMMSGYVGALPYSRIPTAYAAAAGSSSNTNSNSNNTNNFLNLSSSSSSSIGSNSNHSANIGCGSNNSSASTPPTAMTQGPPPMTAQQYHQLQQQHQQHQQQQRLGFTEIQPDTPPQTPPNMKLTGSSSSGGALTLNHLARSGLMGTPTSSTTGMCYNSGGDNVMSSSPAAYARNGASVGINYALAAARAEG